MKVYIGQTQPDGKSILWDEGHDMAQIDPNDNIYNDGTDFYFQTRLSGKDNVGDIDKNYFYAFLAFDGNSWSTYRSSASDSIRSNAANCFELQELTRIGNTQFKMMPLISQQGVVSDNVTILPSDAADILRVVGVYTDEDLAGTNYYDPSAASPVFAPGATEIKLTSQLPASTILTWIKYESQAPVVGPLLVEVPAPTGVITDASIYVDSLLNYTDDKKNGWNEVGEERFSMMKATAANIDDEASLVLARPNQPGYIASVEGVYLTSEMTGTNYYEPLATMPRMMQAGSIDPADSGRTTLIPSDHRNVSDVVGVFVTPEITGTNYLAAAGMSADYKISLNMAPPAGISSMYILYRPALNQTGTLDLMDSSRKTIIPSYKTQVTDVLGVFDNPNFTGINYAAGDLNAQGKLPLSQAFPVGPTPFIKYVWNEVQKGSLFVDPALAAPYMAIPEDVTSIGEVMGVYNNPTLIGTNYLAVDLNQRGRITLTSNPGVDTLYIKYRRTGYNSTSKTISLTRVLPTDMAGKPLYIKYSDLRFTHQIRGEVVGKEIFSPDGGTNARIKGNVLDPTGGMVGLWTDSDRTSFNYFDPRRVPYTDRVPGVADQFIDISTEMSAGTTYAWARYYQKGEFNIDRWNRIVEFFNPPANGTSVQATYMFGTRLPQTISSNTPPVLSAGKLTPLKGTQSTQYVYSVIYTDNDGANGQAPAFIRVIIDGIAHDMTPVSQAAPIYKDGAEYSFTTSGLFGGSHKFYFLASDGADVALYDWYTRNNTTRPIVGETLRSLDGPWVNELPVLTDGKVNPNPAAGITTQDGVEYSVVYSDPENDEPYFFNPLIDRDNDGKPIGVDKSGSPRLYIDSDSNDVDLGIITALEADPIVASKMRTIVATDSNGADPKWSDNEFAGKPMQISSGGQNGRVYLIQSNTHNKLVIAAEDLSKDGIKKDISFRINALLMAKADLTQYDYRTGVQYKITVPKLSILKSATGVVISHKYRFTASSRENKPSWLNDPIPYSATVEFTGTGPKVIDSIPTGNTAPVLSPIGVTNPVTLFAGPRVQLANKLTASTVDAYSDTLFGEIRDVTGVYTTANLDADKLAPVNYYVPANATDPFTNGDKTITLTQDLPNITEDSILVQFGSVGTQLTEVTPERPDVIKTVVGVYTNPQLIGTNYAATCTFANDKIIIPTALPENTEKVYIRYGIKADVVDLPVYVEYFAEYNSSTVFLAGQPLTFRINYLDADDNPPAYHDSVQGYLKLVFTGKNDGTTMMPLNPPVSSFLSSVPFTVTASDMPEGVSKYHFEASDGYFPVRYPADSAADYSIKINNRPVISNPVVDPASGRDITKYTFTATYADKDGIAPNINDVIVRLQLKTDPSVQKTYKMTIDPSETNPNYVTGVKYVATTDQVTALAYGTYSVTFEAKDAYQAAKTVAGHDLLIRDSNNAPIIKSASVAPTTGKLSTSFVYKAVYFDADNDAPVVLKTSGERVKALKLIVDGKTSTPYYMTSTAVNPDYSATAGVEFKFTISGTTLGTGKHRFSVIGYDGDKETVMADGVPSEQQLPVVLVPTFENFKVVLRDNPDSATGITRAIVGDKIIIKGQMKFIYTDLAATPSKIDEGINILLVKPDGGSASVRGSVFGLTTVNDTNGKPSYRIGDVVADYTTGEPKGDATLVSGDSFSLTSNGNWMISASWAGNTAWDSCKTSVVNVEAGGPEMTFAVKDPAVPSSIPLINMITPPMYIGLPDSADVGIVFGYQRAMDMQVVKWDPASKTYLQYGAGGSFAIAPGQAVWIRPKATISTEAVNLEDIISGRLISGNAGSVINPANDYRVIKINGRDYPVQTDTDGKPVVDSITGKVKLKTSNVDLTRGWNQVGSIFFNWFKSADGNDVMPRVDVGIPISELKVSYLGETKTFADATAAGWVKDFAWRWDAAKNKYVLVHATADGAEKTIKAWSGYWVRALVDCELIIDPNTTYNGN